MIYDYLIILNVSILSKQHLTTLVPSMQYSDLHSVAKGLGITTEDSCMTLFSYISRDVFLALRGFSSRYLQFEPLVKLSDFISR